MDRPAIIEATKYQVSRLAQVARSLFLQTIPSPTTTTNFPFLAMYFGCNKGFDALHTAETVSHHSEIFGKEKWAKALNIDHRDNCLQSSHNDNNEAATRAAAAAALPKNPVEVHCIEAMP